MTLDGQTAIVGIGTTDYYRRGQSLPLDLDGLGRGVPSEISRVRVLECLRERGRRHRRRARRSRPPRRRPTEAVAFAGHRDCSRRRETDVERGGRIFRHALQFAFVERIPLRLFRIVRPEELSAANRIKLHLVALAVLLKDGAL